MIRLSVVPFVLFQKCEETAAMKKSGQNHKYVCNRDEQKRGNHDPRKLVGCYSLPVNRHRKTGHAE